MKPHQWKHPASLCTLHLHVASLFVSHFQFRPQLSASPYAGPRLKSRATNLDPGISELVNFDTKVDGTFIHQEGHTASTNILDTHKKVSHVTFVLIKHSKRPSGTHSNVSTRKPFSQCPCTVANRAANIKNGRHSKPTRMHLMMITNRLQNTFSEENLDLA